MNDLRLPNQDSATGRSLKTGAFAVVGSLVVFGSGFLRVLNGVPGCTDAVIGFLQDNAGTLALYVGVPAGALSYGFNFFRKNVKNY